MEYTNEQRESFKREFAVRRKRQIIVAVPVVALFVGFAALTDERNKALLASGRFEILVAAFLTILFGVVIFSVRNWRCPACDRYLGKGMGPRFCPKCGVALR